MTHSKTFSFELTVVMMAAALAAGCGDDEATPNILTSAAGGSGGTSAAGGSGGTSAVGGSGGTSAAGGSGGTSAAGGSGGTSAAGGSGGVSDGGGGMGGTTGFIAELADFQGYTTWQARDYTTGGFHPLVQTAHMAGDDAYSRVIWSNATTDPNPDYPTGTIIVKETFTWENGNKKPADTVGLLAMVKRGGDFNPALAGWEWFVLAPDLSSIMDRGSTEVMGGVCNGCHAQAVADAGTDHVFNHPGEFDVQDADLANYASWTIIETNVGLDPALGSAHKGGDATAERVIYRSPLLGRPDSALTGYPVGTKVVKEIKQSNVVTEITAMVKRGWGFNAANSGWEWFILDPSTALIMARGADLMSGVCGGCHSLANEPANGTDYVFKHAGDPWNK